MQQPIAIVSSYLGLIEALRRRCDQLQISREQLNHLSGLQDGYAQKLLAIPHPQMTMRTLGHLSFDLVIPALGLKLAVLEDETLMPRLHKRLGDPRDEAQVRTKPARTTARTKASAHSPAGLRLVFMRTIATLGGHARAQKLSTKRRSALARRAAKARWRRAREEAR
jgi:hypothetical protein